MDGLLDLHDHGVIFDLDGTLVDSEPFWARGFSTGLADVLEQRGHGRHELRPEDMEQFHGGRVPDTVGAILTSLGLDGVADAELDAVVQATIASVQEDFRSRPIPIADAVAAARELDGLGLRLAVASSSAPGFIDAALEAVGLDDVFAIRLSAIGLAHGKPDPTIYHQTLERLGLPADRVVAIEDSKVGVGAALNARLRCLWFRSPALTDVVTPDPVADLAALDALVDDLAAARPLLSETATLDAALVLATLEDPPGVGVKSDD